MTSEQLDIQHEALKQAHRQDAIASGAITAATGLVLKLAFNDGVTADNLRQHFADRLRSFPEHTQLFREAFGLPPDSSALQSAKTWSQKRWLMLSPNLVRFIDCTAAEIKKEHPELAVDDTSLKILILDKIRAIANDEADAMIEIAKLTQIVKDLTALVRSQP